MSRHKKKSQALFDQQNGACALCSMPIPIGPNQMCYYEPGNVVVCRTCNTIIANYKCLKQPGGVTVGDIEVFLARDPAPEPTVVDPTQHKKQTRGQIGARLCAAQGKIADTTLADYDERFGTSGPVLDPDTGLEWVG